MVLFAGDAARPESAPLVRLAMFDGRVGVPPTAWCRKFFGGS